MIGGATSTSARRSFSGTPVLNVAGASVYCSFLINCTTAPTNSQLVLSVLSSGSAFNGSMIRLLSMSEIPRAATVL